MAPNDSNWFQTALNSLKRSKTTTAVRKSPKQLLTTQNSLQQSEIGLKQPVTVKNGLKLPGKVQIRPKQPKMAHIDPKRSEMARSNHKSPKQF
jgi:hypothetical protein